MSTFALFPGAKSGIMTSGRTTITNYSERRIERDDKMRRYLTRLRSLLGGGLKKKILNTKKWELDKNGNMFFKVRENFEVIVFEHNDDYLDAEYKLLIKKDEDEYDVNNNFESEDDAMLYAHDALKRLKLI